MKKLVLLIMLLSLLISCKTITETNKVVLLQIDYMTNTFEGGKELSFQDSPTFTISSTYQAPGDFGSVQLYYSELDQPLFDGTIIWSGTGEISYPDIDSASMFVTCIDTVPMPDINHFELVMYESYAFYPDSIPFTDMWNSISNLQVVEEYMTSNPIINLFLYTPSVGAGNPYEWDWFVIMNNQG